VDHIVVQSPHWQRTVSALNEIGLHPIRQTDTVRKGTMQVFYRPSECIIELIGPTCTAEENAGSTSTKPARLWGLTLSCSDLDATHAFLASSTKPPWDAVQRGRKITVLQGKFHDISCAVALMSPYLSEKYSSDTERDREASERAQLQDEQLKKTASKGQGRQTE
jgi:hypothetical protein